VLGEKVCEKMLAQAIEAEVVDERGRRHVVRDGHQPERKIVTGICEVAVEQPRVHDATPTRSVDSTRAGQVPCKNAASRKVAGSGGNSVT
jgi:hypothetical protein